MNANILKYIVVSIFIIVGSGCAPQTKISNTKNIPLAEKRLIPNNKEDCLKVNGRWAQVGIPGGSYSCDLKSNDFNKICTDNSQCEGECLVEKSVKIGQKSIGLCSQYLTNFSCYKYLKNGVVEGMCAD